jgi:hypothetical protein
MAKICVYSTFYGLPGFTKDSIRNHLAYCNLHGYTYTPFLFDKPTTRQFSWAKICLGIELLKSQQWDAIFWMDADSWFLDISFPLHAWLADPEEIQFTGDENDIFNGGHFLLKNSSASISWLESCWQVCYTKDPAFVTTHKDSEHLFDQPGILAILGGADPDNRETWARGFNAVNGFPGNPLRQHQDFQNHYAPTTQNRCSAAHALICNRWRPHCLIRPQHSMNSYPWALSGDDFIIHFVGDTKHLMHEWRSRFQFYPQ